MLIHQVLSCQVAKLKHSQNLCFVAWKPQYAAQGTQLSPNYHVAGLTSKLNVLTVTPNSNLVAQGPSFSATMTKSLTCLLSEMSVSSI